MSATIDQTTTVTYKQAITRALADAMEEDARVCLFGEDVAAAGGVFKVTDGLHERFGERRVRDTPIAEQAIIGTAIGAGLSGLRPVAEIMFADFAGVCFDGIANELAKYRYMTGGQAAMPVTVRLGNGAGGGFGAQHSQSVENWFLNVPGLKMVAPATPADAYGLLRAAIRDPDPVLYFEHKNLYGARGELAADPEIPPIGKAAVVRAGTDVTLVATQLMRLRAEEAAELLAREGTSVELIDPRTIAPLDVETIAASLARTNRLVVAQECSHAGSWGASLVSSLVAEHFESLDAPPLVVSGEETPIPYATPLEALWIPSVERIADGVRRALAS
ncbi:alpha-ketoacid dehydrogenase subunit beta [Conexibacter woesei]|uniref:Transketolase central region n=1 Tax=Conexibacter woesei (strain DSM 14684 / CCUG 47730 / CIP 108061 / JCM 11494 / NBRC 100937 / ID131577) TaxID=469383 RepID=D3FCJ4_CONWI|nr:alpha-ketoacid dehydrogenase subunit beta [Conexibacter woesei]ADB49467.1 Transketolase central region [Conexibacter woesei DSM 14684]